jgi:hypothetical protein
MMRLRLKAYLLPAVGCSKVKSVINRAGKGITPRLLIGSAYGYL